MNHHTHFQQTQHFPYSFRQLVFFMLIFSFTFSIFCPSVNASSAETSYIYKDASDNSIQCGNISSYSGKKIGVVKNSMMSSYLNI